MRLLFVNSAWPDRWGGGEKWTIEAADWFRTHGHETVVVGRPNSRMQEAALGRGLKAVETIFGGDFAPSAILRARRILREHRPDVVMVNFNKEAWQFGLAGKMLGVPVVARHGFPLLRRRMHHRVLFTWVLDRLIVNATSIRDHYHLIGYNVEGVEVIHNGTAIVAQKRGQLRKRFGIRADELLVLAAGRLEPQKRFDRVIDIAAALVPRFPNLRLLVAGDGLLFSELQSKIKALGLDGRVQLTGFIPDFAEVAGDADLFLLTSDDEGTPNVLLEAMAASVASVAFAVGAVPDILEGSLADNVITPGNVEAMKERAFELLRDPVLRAQLALESRARIEEKFSLDASMRRFEKVFHRIIGQGK